MYYGAGSAHLPDYHYSWLAISLSHAFKITRYNIAFILALKHLSNCFICLHKIHAFSVDGLTTPALRLAPQTPLTKQNSKKTYQLKHHCDDISVGAAIGFIVSAVVWGKIETRMRTLLGSHQATDLPHEEQSSSTAPPLHHDPDCKLLTSTRE